jgi:hypothetical protein
LGVINGHIADHSISGIRRLDPWRESCCQGFSIIESADVKTIFRDVVRWRDLLSLTVTPCLEDAEAAEVMASLRKA